MLTGEQVCCKCALSRMLACLLSCVEHPRALCGDVHGYALIVGLTKMAEDATPDAEDVMEEYRFILLFASISTVTTSITCDELLNFTKVFSFYHTPPTRQNTRQLVARI